MNDAAKRVMIALDDNNRRAFQEALMNASPEQFQSGHRNDGIVDALLGRGSEWAVDVLWDSIDWSRLPLSRADFIDQAIESGSTSIIDRAVERGFNGSHPLKTALVEDRESTAYSIGTSTNVKFEAHRQKRRQLSREFLKSDFGLLSDLLSNDHFREQMLDGDYRTNLLSRMIADAGEHHPALIQTLMQISDSALGDVLTRLTEARPPEWIHRHFRHHSDRAYYELADELAAPDELDEHGEQLRSAVRSGEDFSAIIERVQTDQTFFYPRKLKNMTLRFVMERFGGADLEKLLNTIDQHTDYRVGSYFDKAEAGVRLSIMAQSRAGLAFFIKQNDHDEEDFTKFVRKLLQKKHYDWLADFYEQHQAMIPGDAFSPPDAHDVDVIEAANRHPQALAALLPLFYDSQQTQFLYNLAVTLCPDSFIELIEAVEHEYDNLYSDCAASAFLSMKNETARRLLDREATVRQTLRGLLRLETSGKKMDTSGKLSFDDFKVLKRHGHLLRNFLREFVTPDHNLEALCAMIIEEVYDEASDSFLVNFFQALRRSCDGTMQTLAPIYQVLKRKLEKTPIRYARFLRQLLNIEQPAADIAQDLCESEMYAEVIRDELTPRQQSFLDLRH